MKNNSDRISPKRLLVDIEEELHKDVKTYAAMRGVSIRCWVRWALQAAVEKEKLMKGTKYHD